MMRLRSCSAHRCQMKSTGGDWFDRHGKYLRSGIVALHEAVRRLRLGTFDVGRFAFLEPIRCRPGRSCMCCTGSSRITGAWHSVLAAGLVNVIPKGYFGTLQICGRCSDRQSPSHGCKMIGRLCEEKPKPRPPHFVERRRNAAILHRRLVGTGTARTAARHLIHPGCSFGQKHAENLSE